MDREADKIEKRVVEIRERTDIHEGIFEAKDAAESLGFDNVEQALIGTVVSELTTNILRYAKKGILEVSSIFNARYNYIEIKAIDNGPGIVNIEKALEANYTTTKNSLGMGLPSVKKIMDDFQIESELEFGTTVTVRKWVSINEN